MRSIRTSMSQIGLATFEYIQLHRRSESITSTLATSAGNMWLNIEGTRDDSRTTRARDYMLAVD